MAITLRSVKGSALSHTELDANFTTLQSDDNALQVQIDALPTLGANTFQGTQIITGSLKVTNGITGSVTQAALATIANKAESVFVMNNGNESADLKVVFAAIPGDLGNGAQNPLEFYIDETAFEYNPDTKLLSVTASHATTATSATTATTATSATTAVTAQTGSKVSIINETNDNTNFRVLFAATPSNTNEGATVPGQVLLDPTGLTYNPSTDLLTVTSSWASNASSATKALAVQATFEGNMEDPTQPGSIPVPAIMYVQTGTAMVVGGKSQIISVPGAHQGMVYSVSITPLSDSSIGGTPTVFANNLIFYVEYDYSQPEVGFTINSTDQGGNYPVMYTIYYTV